MTNSREKIEEMANRVSKMDNAELIREIKSFKGRFELDFSEEHLSKLTIDRLMHILLAAYIINSKPTNDNL